MIDLFTERVLSVFGIILIAAVIYKLIALVIYKIFKRYFLRIKEVGFKKFLFEFYVNKIL